MTSYGKNEFKKCANALKWKYDEANNTIDIIGENVLLFVETISIERPQQPQRRMPFSVDFLNGQVSTTRCFSLGTCSELDFFLSVEYVAPPTNGSSNYRIDFVELINNAKQFFSANPGIFCKRFDGTSTKATNEKVGSVTCIKYKDSNGNIDASELGAYLMYFDNRPYRHVVTQQLSNNNNWNLSMLFFLLQKIFYGAPGTGKSFSIKSVIAEHMSIDVDQVDMEADNIFRTTFHPDYDYAQFVGCYKPTKEKNGDITYDFVPQVFVNALVEAYGGVQPAKSSSNTSATTDQVADGETKKDDLNEEETVVEQTVESEVETQAVKPVYLVIEEINRGNCAQIFGDIFQLLDRNANGESEYSISVDKDLREYLEINCPNAICNGKIKIPANLSIIATMNTSDQSLFPMDSAFKRRWEWEYVPIKNQNFDKDGNQVHFKIVVEKGKYEYDWNEFQNAVNIEIQKKTHSEDKQMGDYFIKKDVSLDEFINKVMFYLWNDVCKENYHTEDNFFRTEDESTEEEMEFSFGEMMADKVNKINGFMRKLKVKNLIETSESTDASDVSTPESSAD